jgi:hypothetical protein
MIGTMCFRGDCIKLKIVDCTCPIWQCLGKLAPKENSQPSKFFVEDRKYVATELKSHTCIVVLPYAGGIHQ